MNENFVFVYGTLKKNQRANYMLNDSEYIGEGYIENYVMYNLGAFPGIKFERGDENKVYGEIYKVDSETLERLDSYEGYPSFYGRDKVIVYPQQIICDVYVYNGTCNKIDIIEKGVWK